MACYFCNGNLTHSVTTHVSDFGKRTIIVRGVPCLKCDQCVEISYEGNVFQQVEAIVDALKDSIMEVAITNYLEKAA